MEATLFWIGCGLGVYGWLLRKLFTKGMLESNRALALGTHLLFTIGAGGLIGFVLSASTELQGPTPKLPITGAVLGIVWGLFQWSRSGKSPEGTRAVVADDLEWVETSFSAILLASVIMYSILQAFKIPSGSMENTLLIRDHLFVNKFIYGIRVPYTDKRILRLRAVRRGDIVVFEAPPSTLYTPEERERGVKKDYIKRAVALPGDTVEVRDKRLFVNGQPQQEPYVAIKDPRTYPAARLPLSPGDYQAFWESGKFAALRRQDIGDNFGPVVVPPGKFMVMGDNRDGSFDSRFWGPLPERYLKGRAWVVYWPLSRIKVIR